MIVSSDPDLIYSKIDELKKSSLKFYQNLFTDADKLKLALKHSKAGALLYPKSVLIYLPKHEESWYDILFVFSDLEEFKLALNEGCASLAFPARIRIVDKNNSLACAEEAIAKAGFRFGVKIARMCAAPYEDMKSHFDARLNNWQPDFPHAGEAEHILSLLLTEFDPRNHNVPELKEIEEDIARKHIIVVRDADKIISLHYFKITNAICFRFYDVTNPSYRHKGINLAINKFFYENCFKNNRFSRAFEWRDINKKEIMEFSKKIGEKPDGVTISTWLYK